MPDAEFPIAQHGLPGADPSARTMDQLRREIGGLRELIEARLNGNDKAIDLLQHRSDMQPTTAVLDIALKALDEKIAMEFLSSKEAVHSSQQSSQTAIAKSETAMDKRMDGIGALIASSMASLDSKITDMKDRLTVIEARGVGVKDQKEDHRAVFGYIVGVVGLVISLLTIAGFVLANRAASGI